MQIGERPIGQGAPVFKVAELSGNAGQDYSEALKLITAAKDAGADAVKLQTYEPEKMFDKNDIIQGLGPPWDGLTGAAIYHLIAMPWPWQAKLKKFADEIGIILFTTVCQRKAVDFWENQMPAYKIAEWQAKDWQFVEYVNKMRKPIIISVKNISQPFWASKYASDVAFLAKDDLFLMDILRRQFNVPIGYSNHAERQENDSQAHIKPCIVAASKGACIVEQHFTLSRDTIDGKFAAMPEEFKQMADEIRAGEA